MLGDFAIRWKCARVPEFTMELPWLCTDLAHHQHNFDRPSYSKRVRRSMVLDLPQLSLCHHCAATVLKDILLFANLPKYRVLYLDARKCGAQCALLFPAVFADPHRLLLFVYDSYCWWILLVRRLPHEQWPVQSGRMGLTEVTTNDVDLLRYCDRYNQRGDAQHSYRNCGLRIWKSRGDSEIVLGFGKTLLDHWKLKVCFKTGNCLTEQTERVPRGC